MVDVPVDRSQALPFPPALAHNRFIARTSPSRIETAHAEGSTDARLCRIVQLLSDNATIVVSGARMAEELGTSRSEVWRAVEQLRELGVRITGHPATGYQLMAVPDLLLPDTLAPLLSGTLFASHINHFFRIGSTNTEAMRAASRGEPEGAVFIAEEQTAGRGRGGHSWESVQSAGIYCSVVLRPKLAPVDAVFLTMMAGIAVAEAVEQTTGLHPDLRWPNDLLFGERKFCGILTEMSAEPTRIEHVVVGIGINVNQASFSGELEPIATSLSMEGGREWSRVQLTAALLKSLDSEYRRFVEGGADAGKAVMSGFEKRSSWVRGRHVRIGDDSGLEGVTDGLDDRGFLLLRTRDGVRRVLSGNVRAATGK